MNKEKYDLVEAFMNDCMKDSAHDRLHIFRVLYHAVDIAKHYDVDDEVLITATLLHDIGREQQIKNIDLDHAIIGAEMAHTFLSNNYFADDKIEHICDAIRTHRFRSNNPPKTIEAKILFDADKLDVSGAIGIARTLVYKGAVGEMLYSVDDHGMIVRGDLDTDATFFHEYNYKLKGLYQKFYTDVARDMALEREAAAKAYYNDLYNEMEVLHTKGKDFLYELLD